MAVFETWLKTDLKKPVKVQQIGGVVFSQDNKANKVGVIVSEGGRPVELSGTVYGYVIIPTGETVEVEGAIEDTNKAYFLMPQECYVEGQISIVIKLTSGDVITTIGACTAYVYKSKTSAEVVPSGTPIPDLSVLMEAIDDAMEQVDGLVELVNTQVGLVAAEGAAQVAAVEEKGEEVLESIPEDYSDLENDVDNLKNVVDSTLLEETTINVSNLQAGRILSDGTIGNDPNWRTTDFIEVPKVYNVYYHVCTYKATGYCLAAYYDSDKQFISAEAASSTKGGSNNYNEGNLVIPSGAVYFRVNMWTNNPIPADRENQYITYYENSVEKKVSIDQGSENVDSLLFVDNTGMVVPNKELATNVHKIGSFEMLSDENTITGAVAEINSKNIVSSVDRNIITNSVISGMSTGLLNTSGVLDTASTGYLTTDYIQVSPYWDILFINNIYRICAYDNNKTFIEIPNVTNSYVQINNESYSYIRISISAENKDSALICPFQWYDEAYTQWDKPTGLNNNGKTLAPNLLSDIIDNDETRFSAGSNLFDLQKGFLWVANTANVPYLPGNGNLNVIGMMQLNASVRKGTSTIPTNGSIASSQMIPITPGKYLITNFDRWNSPCYDNNMNYVGYIPSVSANDGVLIPAGYSYVRINFVADGSSQSPTVLKSLEDAKNIIVYESATRVVPYMGKFSLPKQVDGVFVSPNYLDKVIPSMNDSEFLSAMKCLAIREINKRDHAYRFGNFNIWVSTNTKGYFKTRRMLMDHGVDFCGFEEVSGRGTDIGKYLESWQFASGFESPKNDSGNVINSLSIVSRFTVQTWNTYTLTSVTGNKDCINARIRLPRLYDVYNPYRILSMYAIHPMIGADRVALANEFLSIIASDTSDYIVVVSDTNDFADVEENKLFWETLKAGGLTPVIPLESKTITQDDIGKQTDTYPEQQWRWNCIDQIFVSSNVEFLNYNVVNTKDEYPVDTIKGGGTNNDPALSDHDFVYADLRFKNEVRDNMPTVSEP